MGSANVSKAVVAILLSAVFALPAAAAQDKPGRKEIEKIVEEYILAHPEVIERSMRTYYENMKKGMADAEFKQAFGKRKTVAEDDAPTMGDPAAPITIVEFSDFQCPYCAASVKIMKDLRLKYGGLLRFVFKHFPLENHHGARPAARASVAAHKQGKFWEYHDLLMARQGEWSQAGDMEKIFARYAAELGMDAERFKGDMNGAGAEEAIARNVKQAMELEVGATPTFFVNGVQAPGAQDVNYFSRVIEELLKPRR